MLRVNPLTSGLYSGRLVKSRRYRHTSVAGTAKVSLATAVGGAVGGPAGVGSAFTAQ